MRTTTTAGAEGGLERPVGTSTTLQAMVNSVNVLLGVGLLSMPYALQQGGWAGLGVLAMLGAITNYTGKALIRCQRSGSRPPLPSQSHDASSLTSYGAADPTAASTSASAALATTDVGRA